MITYLRHTEKKYRESGAETGGLMILDEMLKQGLFEMENYLNIRKAVQNYNTPYEITFK